MAHTLGLEEQRENVEVTRAQLQAGWRHLMGVGQTSEKESLPSGAGASEGTK